MTKQMIPQGPRKYIKPPASEDCEWRSGPPPSVGWWPASVCGEPDALRWWNGKFWSWAASSEYSSRIAARKARVKESMGGIQWTNRWWLKGCEA